MEALNDISTLLKAVSSRPTATGYGTTAASRLPALLLVQLAGNLAEIGWAKNSDIQLKTYKTGRRQPWLHVAVSEMILRG